MAQAQAKAVIDLSGLQWVRSELDQNLERVHQFIEAFLENPEDKLPLQRSVIELHQARGILAMVRLHGAALLAEELRQAVHDVLHGATDNIESVFEVVLGGAVQLADYLDFVQSEGKDSALVFQPLINELRVARSKPVVDESELFVRFLLLETPEITLPDLSQHDGGLASNEARTFQLHFQAALLGVIKDRDSNANLMRLGQICQQVLKSLSEPQVFQQWWFAEAVIEALLDRGLEVGLDIKRLFGKLGILLKYLATEGQESPRAVDLEVTYALLYYVGRSTSQGEKVRAVRQACALDKLLPDQEQLDTIRERLRGPNTSLLKTLSKEIRQDISMVKDNLDLLLRAGDKAPDRLDETVETIRRVATTLDMLGMTALQRVVSRQAEVVDKRRHQAIPDQREWLDAAVSLLWVEHSLDELLFRHVHPDAGEGEAPPEEPGEDSISPLELREGAASILREALINVARSKDLTNELLSDGGAEQAQEIAHLIHEISAGLSVIGIDHADVQKVERLRDYTRDPAFQYIGRQEALVLKFADAISALELYLTALQERQANGSALITQFGTYVDRLEWPAAPAAAVEPASEPSAAEPQEAVQVITQDVDPEIREIFLEEAGEIREMLAEQVPHWSHHVDDREALVEIRRAFHTLKGSGRMAGADAIGDYGWAVEQMINSCLDGSLPVDHAVVETVKQANEQLPGLIEAYSQSSALPAGARQVIIDAHRISGVEAPESISQPSEEQSEEEDLWQIFGKDAQTHLGNLKSAVEQARSEQKPPLMGAEVVRAFHTLKSGARIVGAGEMSRLAAIMEELGDAVRNTGRPMTSELVDLIADVTHALERVLATRGDGQAAGCDLDSLAVRAQEHLKSLPQEASEDAGELMIIFTDEACDLLESIESDLDDWAQAPEDPHYPQRLLESCEKLSETARTAGVEPVAMVARQIQALVADWQDEAPGAGQLSSLLDTLGGAYDILDRVRQGARVEEAGDLLARLQQLGETSPEPEATPSVVEEAVPSTPEFSFDPGVPPASELSDHAVAGETVPAQTDTPDKAPEPLAGEQAMPDQAREETGAEEMPQSELVSPAAQHPQMVPETPVSTVDEAGSSGQREVDDSLLRLFVEEGDELLESIGAEVDRWEGQPENPGSLVELMRLLHTLKGSARMAGASRIGDLSHDLEDQLADLARQGHRADSDFFARVRQTGDEIHRHLESIRAVGAEATDAVPAPETSQPVMPEPEAVPPASAPSEPPPVADETAGPQVMPSEPEEPVAIGEPTASMADEASEEADVPQTPASAQTETVAPAVSPATPEPQRTAGASETTRVSVSQLDRMFNEAGEVGTYLGRLETQQADLRTHLGEMSQAITRMRDQIRQLDMEAESQLQAHQPQGVNVGDRYEEAFDPLEMDRYTRLNELSRSLNESAADLVSLQTLMEDVSRSNDTLLLQQGRITSNLQHGLMNTMLVPFSGLVQRMQRIVRQTCQAYGKQARIEFSGADNELDRNVLERMVGPLEHLLRNSVVHGIETPEQRRSAAKEPQGVVRVSLRRDGTQSIIEVADDGRGLDLASIRRTAVQKHLISDDAKLSEQELVQLIFEPGFSTAQAVTHEAGRGVGMDVVNAEIKQLGGTLNVSFTPGQGTQFLLRIPSSLALTQALLVRVGHENYAIGMASIDGIERLPRSELSRYLADDGPQVLYGGHGYQAIRLNEMINTSATESAEEESKNIPVLLMRAGDMRLAVVVDQVLGGEELVVKSLGPQVSAIPGVSGGTIMADGSVVLILDVPTLYQTRHRRLLSVGATRPAETESVRDERPLVMIVDDSITIRRVTERFLVRHGYRVDTARDGMDALPKLQEEKPQVVLLDVEMPRIDGFEVATYMRNDEHLKQVPIVMITSRSGEKHRQRAKEIGVDRYLVKPYQEDQLLSTIEAVLHERSGQLH